jgi:hypothetical protein
MVEVFHFGGRLGLESSYIWVDTVFCAMNELRALDGRYKMCVRIMVVTYL